MADSRDKQPEQQKEQPFEVQPGDEHCRSCTGVLFYTKCVVNSRSLACHLANLTTNLLCLHERVGRISAMREKGQRSEEHTSELQSLMRISYAVFCLKKKKITTIHMTTH